MIHVHNHSAKGLSAAKLKIYEDLWYLFVLLDQFNSKLSHYRMNVSWYGTEMDPLQVSNNPFMNKVTMQDRIMGLSKNGYVDDANIQNIGTVSGLLANHKLMFFFAE